MSTPALRFRIHVDGAVVVDELIGPDDAAEAGIRHGEVCSAAGDRGQTWVMEVTDPDGEIAPMRFSNRPEELVAPVLATPAAIARAIEDRRP